MIEEQKAADVRSAEILDNIKGIFASKGFDGASMQDLARGARMSAGNFYRYFPSKNAIVEALIEREIALVREIFAVVLGAPDPRRAFATIVRERVASCDACEGPIWAEIEASAARKPEIAALIEKMEREVRQNLLVLFSRIAPISVAEAERRFSAQAHFILLIVQALAMRAATFDPRAALLEQQLVDLVIETIDRILDAVSEAQPAAHASAHV